MRIITLLLLLAAAAGTTLGAAAQAPTSKVKAKTKTAAGAHTKVVVKHAKPAAGAARLATTAPTLLYKTNGDYHDLVPVTLSDDRRSIVAYPAPADVAGTQPTPLAQGYWLDNRGIGPHVAFLKLTYADYARLTTAPTLQAMDALIVDRDPLTSYCDCGPRSAYANPAADLNALITAGNLPSRCKVLK